MVHAQVEVCRLEDNSVKANILALVIFLFNLFHVTGLAISK